MEAVGTYHTRFRTRPGFGQHYTSGREDPLRFLDNFGATRSELTTTPQPAEKCEASQVTKKDVAKERSTVPIVTRMVLVTLVAYDWELVVTMIVVGPAIAILSQIVYVAISKICPQMLTRNCPNAQAPHDELSHSSWFSQPGSSGGDVDTSLPTLRQRDWEPRRTWRDVAPFIFASFISLIRFIAQCVFLLFLLKYVGTSWKYYEEQRATQPRQAKPL